MANDEQDADREAFVKETAAKAVAKYEGRIAPWLVREMRAALEEILATHPAGAALTDRVRPRKAPLQSGDVVKEGVAANEPAVLRKEAKR